MFQDTKSGQTHSFGDGCGEPEHNVPAKWEERFDRKFNYIGAIDSVVNDRSLNIREVNIVNDIKDFIREAISEAVEEERKKSEVVGYEIALETLKAHIKKQIYQPTLSTESLISYIDDAIKERKK